MKFKQHFSTILFLFIYGNTFFMQTNTLQSIAKQEFNVGVFSRSHPAELFLESLSQSDSDRVILKSGKEMVCEVKDRKSVV